MDGHDGHDRVKGMSKNCLQFLLFAATAATLLLANAVEAAPRTYDVDTEQSQLFVRVFRSGLLSGLGHDHLFMPQRWSGTIRFDPEAPPTAQARLRVAADSLQDHEPGLSDSDRAKVNAQVRDQVLEARRFPSIDIVADRLETEVPQGSVSDSGAQGQPMHGQLVGIITLHGVTRPIRIPFQATVAPIGIAGSGSVRLNVKEFGIEPGSAALGTVSVKDEVLISFELNARPVAAAAPAGP